MKNLTERQSARWCVWDDGDVGTLPTEEGGRSFHIANTYESDAQLIVDAHNAMLDRIAELSAALERVIAPHRETLPCEPECCDKLICESCHDTSPCDTLKEEEVLANG